MHITREKFEEFTAEVLDELPEEYVEHMNNVAIIVEEDPTPEQQQKIGLHMKLYGLFEGVRQAARINVGVVQPDRIYLFINNICSISHSQKDIKENIRATLYHEIAHHFGSDEDGARKAARHQK